jgi:hypothetical protein
MAVLMFIYMADEKLGLAVKSAALIQCKSVGDLVQVCEGRVRD